MLSQRPRVLICERGDALILAVRRALVGLDARTVRTITPLDARAELAERSRSIAVVELTERSLDAALDLIAWARSVSECRVVAVLERGLEAYEPLARELGAAHVVVSARDLSCVRLLVEGYLIEPAARAREEGFAASFGDRDRMAAEALARLPWGD